MRANGLYLAEKSSFARVHELIQKGWCGLRVAALREIALGGLKLILNALYHRHTCPVDIFCMTPRAQAAGVPCAS